MHSAVLVDSVGDFADMGWRWVRFGGVGVIDFGAIARASSLRLRVIARAEATRLGCKV